MNNQTQFQGKRLLILGNRTMTNALDIIQITKQLGIYTIVATDTPDHPIKKIADKSYDICLTDIDALFKLAKSENIDGVIAGTNDNEFTISQAITLCEKLGLHYYVTREQWDIMQNKIKFKDVCRQFNISVPEDFYIDADFKESDIKKITYPVIIKPADASGGLGVSVCKNETELRAAYGRALSWSKSKNVILEKYIVGDAVTVYYTVQDGYISLSAMSEKCHVKKGNFASLPYLLFFPSKYTPIFLEDNDKKIKNMLKYLNVKNGFLFIQGFFVEGEFVVHEMGYRFTGTDVYKIISAVNGVNAFEMFIRYSVSGEMSGWDLKHYDNPNFMKCVCIWRPFIKKGKIMKISGLDEISNYSEIINMVSFYSEGDILDDSLMGSLAQAVIMVSFIADTKEMLINTVKRAEKELIILDENGENMLLDVDMDSFDI